MDARPPGGTPAQMAADLKGGCPQFPEHMAVVLRGLMAALQDHPDDPDPAHQVPHE